MTDVPGRLAQGGQQGSVAENERRTQALAPGAQPRPARRPPPALLGPTSRPGEPVTAGLPSGPGPGPEALMTAGLEGELTVEVLQRIHRVYPSETIARLIDVASRGI